MLDTTDAVIEFLTAAYEKHGSDNVDFAFEYGEPGYYFKIGAKTPLIMLGDHWCRCDKFGSDKLHGIDKHYPYAFAALGYQGVEFEWYDEWVIDPEYGKAYRCEPDSYSWKPSYIVTDDGEFLTADDDLDAWLEWAINDPSRAIMGHIYNGTDLEAAGFTQYQGQFESGWHPGQDANPERIARDIETVFDEPMDYVFVIDENSQFYMGFSAYCRPSNEDNN